MTPTRESLADDLSRASSEVVRTEAALDEAERSVRTCPHVFGAFDRDPASYDARGMADEARSALASLSVAQSALSHVFSGSGVRPTFEEARNALAHLSNVLAGMPDDEAAILQDETMARVADHEANAARLASKLHDLVGPGGDDAAAVTGAAAGLHVLRARYGMSTVVHAESCLSDMIGERSSLADLRSLWAGLLADLGLDADVRHDVLVSALQQVVALGTEAILACRRLPARSRSVLLSFDERRRAAVRDKEALVRAYGTAWLSQAASRLGKASDILARADGQRNALAVEFAESLGVEEARSATLAAMARTVDAIVGLDNDVEAAKVLGVNFAGAATDVESELEMLERWFWLQEERQSGPENEAVADAALCRDPGALLALERRLSAFLASLSAYEATYGTGWHDRSVDERKLADLDDNLALIRQVGLRDDDAFDRIFEAFLVLAAAEREKAAVNALRHSCIPLVDDVYARLSKDALGYLERTFPDATFQAAENMPDLLASVVSGRDAMEASVSSLGAMNLRAGYALFDARSSIAEVADWLPQVLDADRIRDARLAWSEAHEALDAAEVAVAEFDLTDARREEQERLDRESAAVATKAAAAARAVEQADARTARQSAEDALHGQVIGQGASGLALALVPAPARRPDGTVAQGDVLETVPAVVTPIWPGAVRDGRSASKGPTRAASPAGTLIPDVAIRSTAVGTDWVESHLSALGVQDRRSAAG